MTPAIKDPNLVWIWAAPAIVLAVQTVVFWIKYRKYDDDEFMTEEAAEHTPDASSTASVKTTKGNDGEKL
jgi:cytochrome c-type biogenesis protein CcmH/NrfF